MKLSELKRICEEDGLPDGQVERPLFPQTSKYYYTFYPARVKKMLEMLELARDFIGTNSIDQMNGYHEVPEAKSWLKIYKSEFENENK